MLSVIETSASKIVFCLKFAKLAQSWIILYFVRLVVRRQRSVKDRSVSDSRHYHLPAFSRWSYRSIRADRGDTLANPVVKEGRGVPHPVTNEGMSSGTVCAGGTRSRRLPYSVTSGHSRLSHYISLPSGARIYLGTKFCRICKVHM